MHKVMVTCFGKENRLCQHKVFNVTGMLSEAVLVKHFNLRHESKEEKHHATEQNSYASAFCDELLSFLSAAEISKILRWVLS